MNNNKKINLVYLTKLLSSDICIDACEIILSNLFKHYLKKEKSEKMESNEFPESSDANGKIESLTLSESSEITSQEENKGMYSTIIWDNNGSVEILNINDMLNTWGYIFSGSLISPNGNLIPIEILAINIKQHEDPRFLMFNIAVIKLNNDFYEFNDNNLSIGSALFDTKYNQINMFFNVNKQSEFKYPYFKYLNIVLKEDGFEGWVKNDDNYKKNDSLKLDANVEKLNTEVEYILLTSRNNDNELLNNYNGLLGEFIILNKINALVNKNDISGLKQFLNTNKKLYSYWSQRFLDETYFNSKK